MEAINIKITSLSEIGKGPLFENNDIMGLGEGTPTDENWSLNKEEEIISMFRRGEEGLVNKDANLKMRTLAARDKLLAGEIDAKTRLFGKQSFNFSFNNKKMFRGGNMYNNNYSKKVEDIMGKSKKASKVNYESKVSMIMGKQGNGGGFGMGGFDKKAKSYLGMGGGGMKNPMQKMQMLSGNGKSPKHIDNFFTGVPKPSSKIDINALIGGAKSKGMSNMGIPGNGGIDIQSMIGMAKQKNIPNLRPQGNGTREMIMGVKNDMTSQNKINNMLGMQNISGVKNMEVMARMGMVQKPENIAWNRVNLQKKLNLFGDADGDKISNILDCEPMNKNAQGFWGNIGGAITKGGRGISNILTYGRSYGGFEVGEGVPTRKEEKLTKVFEKEKLASERERDVLEAKYGKDMPIEKIHEMEVAEKTARVEAIGEGRISKVKAQVERAKILPQEATAQVKIMKAQQDLMKLQTPSTTISGSGKKQKIEFIGGQQGFGGGIIGSPISGGQQGFGGGIIGSPISGGFGYGSNIGGGLTTSFGSGTGVAQMSGITHTGAGLQMANLGSTGAGFGMAALPTSGQGMGFSQMTNIQSGSGTGFHQMLGIAPPIQEQPMAEPVGEPVNVQPQIISENSMMVEGVEYKRLSSGKWKNTKTGKEVMYPRGKYEKIRD